MAIPTGAYQLVDETAETALTTTASIADGGYSSSANATVTTIDNSTDGYPLMDLVINCTMAATPVAGDYIGIFLQGIAMFGDVTLDENQVDANNEDGYVGSIPLDSGQTAQTKRLRGIPIPKGKFQVVIKAGGEAINSGAVVKIQRNSGATA